MRPMRNVWEADETYETPLKDLTGLSQVSQVSHRPRRCFIGSMDNLMGLSFGLHRLMQALVLFNAGSILDQQVGFV